MIANETKAQVAERLRFGYVPGRLLLGLVLAIGITSTPNQLTLRNLQILRTPCLQSSFLIR
jgi:hypothetical protein